MKRFVRVAVMALLGAVLIQQAPRLASLPGQRPLLNRRATAPPSALIVQGKDVASVAAQVRAVGGLVTHELGIINAVAARLTSREAALLRREDPSLHFYADREVRSTAAVTTATRTVLNDVSQVSYANNSGTQSWGYPWSDNLKEAVAINVWVPQE